MSQRLPVSMPQFGGLPVPTGPALLALVKWCGDQMLAQSDHGEYLAWREWYLQLLQVAERDTYCAPILISVVQDVLDEEARHHRRG